MSESSYDEHDHDHEEDATHFSTCHCSDPHTKPAAAPLAAVDYKQTNKDHHNAPGHAHNHSNSALNQWTARKVSLSRPHPRPLSLPADPMVGPVTVR